MRKKIITKQPDNSKETNSNVAFMNQAIVLAKKALKKQEVPIGAVVVYEGKIISKGYNCREKSQNALNHAETIAIKKACKKLRSWRLDNCQLYVTLEPCPMCAGAIANARISQVYYGAKEKTSNDNLCEAILSSTRLNHKCEMIQVEECEKECSKLLTEFFKSKRKSKQ